jgi:flagellar hook protein FlgE
MWKKEISEGKTMEEVLEDSGNETGVRTMTELFVSNKTAAQVIQNGGEKSSICLMFCKIKNKNKNRETWGVRERERERERATRPSFGKVPWVPPP